MGNQIMNDSLEFTDDFLDDLFEEFRPYFDDCGGNFRHVVNTELGLAQSAVYYGQPEEANTHYEAVRKYVFALRNLPNFRERELAFPIPDVCRINCSDTGEYIDRAYSQAREKSPE